MTATAMTISVFDSKRQRRQLTAYDTRNEAVGLVIGRQYRCPVPGCGHVGTEITYLHYEAAHGMTKKEAHTAHGKPEPVRYDGNKAKANLSAFVEPGRLNRAYPSQTEYAKERRQQRRGRG